MAILALTAGPGCEAPKRADVPPDPRLRQVEDELAESLRALDAERAAGDALRRAEAEIKAKADEVKALEKKLSEVVGTVGDVTTEDGAVRVELPFITNWDLSAARALTVVHYLQDEAKLDPARLAAVAFGQYRPSSKSRAKNRRIEIVLYPRAKISPK